MAKSNIIALTFILFHLLSVVQGGRGDTVIQAVLVDTPLCDCENNPNVLEYKGSALVSGTDDVYKHEYEISIDSDQGERCEDLDPVKYVVISVDQDISNNECKSRMSCSAYAAAVNLEVKTCEYCGMDSSIGCSVSTGTDKATAGQGIKVKLPKDKALYPFTFYVCMNGISDWEIGTLYYMPTTFTPAFMCPYQAIPRLCDNPSQPPTTPPSHPPTSPPSQPPTSPPSQPPTTPPSSPPSQPPTSPPSQPPTSPPSQPPTTPPSQPPTSPPSQPPSQPPTEPPSRPPTTPPSQPPTSPPSQPPSRPPTSPPSQPPTSPPSQPPTSPPSQPPSQPPTEPPSRPPTTPPTKKPSVFPTTSPISVPCDDFESGERLADYFVLSDMSSAGSYNTRCDYYRNKAMSIGINNHFAVDKYYGKNKMTIGNVMEITFDLFVHSHCTNSNTDDCVIFRIGQHQNDTYPLIKITPSRAIQVILTLNDGQVMETSANHVIHNNYAARMYVKWTQETIQVTYDGILVIDAEIGPHPYETQSFYVDGSSTFKFEMYAGNVDSECGDAETSTLNRVIFACHVEPDGATDSPQYVAEDICQNDNTHLYTAQWLDVVDCAANRDLSDANGPVEVWPDGEVHPCCESAEVADATITNLCVQTDWRPWWDKDYVTLCFMKQNFAAEAYTALKGTDQQQASGDDGWMNVRSGYIEFDGDGATVLTALDDDINIYPVTITDLLEEFRMIQDSDCGAGTDDVTDLCAGLEAAFDNFDTHQITPESEGDPFRERKIFILSNNMNLTCNDGGISDICERFHDRIYGVGGAFPGVALVQTNVDMAGQVADNTYELCLTKNATANILDVDSFGDLSYKDSVDDRDELINKIQHQFCTTIPTSIPTRPPTSPPSQPPTSPPSQPPTSPPSQPPTTPPSQPPTEPPSQPPSRPPTSPPSQPPSQPPTEPPSSQPPTSPPSQPPTSPPSQPPTTPPSQPPSRPPTSPPSQPPTSPPSQPPTSPPSQPPSQPPTEPPSQPPSRPPTSPPSQPPTSPPSARPFKPKGCMVNWYIDLILSVDISCAMTRDECVQQQLLVADTFISLRTNTTRVINGVEWVQTRVSYIEMGSDSVVDILIDFPNALNEVDRSVMSIEQQNEAYYDYIVSRGDVICAAAALSARVGNPSLRKIAKNIESLFDWSDNLNDKEVAVFSNCGVADRAYTCEAYLDSRKAIIHNNPGDGINVQMANYVPQGDTSDSMGDPATYMACMVEYDTSGRIFVYNGTNDMQVVGGLRDSICQRQPTPAPTSDPTMDPTRDPTTEPPTPSPLFCACGQGENMDLIFLINTACITAGVECDNVMEGIAELWSLVKGFVATPRIGVITFDGLGSEIVTFLNDSVYNDITIRDTFDEDARKAFYDGIRAIACDGNGADITDTRTDTLSAIQTAFEMFSYAEQVYLPSISATRPRTGRDKKIVLISACANTNGNVQSVCDAYGSTAQRIIPIVDGSEREVEFIVVNLLTQRATVFDDTYYSPACDITDGDYNRGYTLGTAETVLEEHEFTDEIRAIKTEICQEPTPAPATTPSPVGGVCGNDQYIDLIISVDISCPMTRDECVQQQLLVADTFANLRVNSTRLINGVEWVQTRVSYIEMGSDSVVDILIDFPDARNEVDRSVMSIEQQNEAYYDYIVSRGDVICEAAALAARVGNPSLRKIAKNIESLFDWSDNLNDKEVAVFSNCGVANRTYTCKAYLDSRKAIIHNNPGDGINIQMANYVPLAPNTLGAESMADPATYMACMVEYDVDGRIFVYNGTNDAEVVQGLTESICMVQPSPSPTADPTSDPTRDPVGSDAAVVPVENINVGHGVGDGVGEGKDVYMLWEEYSLWIFAAIVSIFGLNVFICAYCGCIRGGNNRSKGRKYGFINNGAIEFDDEDDTDCELDSDNDIEKLVQYK